MYQARDLPAMDKDSFSGRWEKVGEPGTRDRELETEPLGLWIAGNTAHGSSCRLGAVFAGFVKMVVVARVTVAWPPGALSPGPPAASYCYTRSYSGASLPPKPDVPKSLSVSTSSGTGVRKL